ncbi:MAG: transposase [Patescibacteria group bacterium]
MSTFRKRLRESSSAEEKREIYVQLEEKRISSPVDLISFCIMPTHPHLTVKQLKRGGVSDYMHRVFTSYSRYFNIRQERKGSLFESTFKSVEVNTDEQLIHLSRYQHINPRALGLNSIDELIAYPWSSLSSYLGIEDLSYVNPEPILSLFSDFEEYAQFISAEIDQFEPFRLESVALDDDFGWFSHFRQLDKQRKEALRREFTKTLSA